MWLRLVPIASFSVASSTVPTGIDRELTGTTPTTSPDDDDTVGADAHAATPAHARATMTMDFMEIPPGESSCRLRRKPRARRCLRSGVERRISRTHDDAGLDHTNGGDAHPGALFGR